MEIAPVNACGLRESGRRLVRPTCVRLAVLTINVAELGVTDANGVLQHGREHRLQIAGRAADNLEHLRRCGLLFQRLRRSAVCGAVRQQPCFSMAMTAWAAKVSTT